MKVSLSRWLMGDSEARSVVARILRQSLRHHWRPYLLSFVYMAIAAAATAGTVWIIREMVNNIFVHRDPTQLVLVSGAIALLFIIKGIATYLQLTSLSWVGNRIVAQNQQQLFDHLLLMDVNFFTTGDSSDLITRVSFGAQAARRIVDLIVTSVGRDALTLVALAVVVIAQAPVMSSIALLVAPVAVIGVLALGRRIRSYAQAEMQGMTQIVAVLQETSQGARIVKAFGLDDYMRGRMAEAIAGVEQRANQIAVIQARTNPIMEMLIGVGLSLVLLFAGWQAIAFDRTPGEFMAFLTALLLAYEPARRLAKFHVEMAGLQVMVKMMFDLLDRLPSATEMPNAPPLTISKAEVELRDVSFAYRPETPVLRQVSFSVGAGERVALVGPSGGGKTTILHLIQRFYDVEEGAILVNGQDIRGVSASSLRAAISYVSQDTYLFSGSVRENIRLGNLAATDEQVEQAARDAHAEEYILMLPHGYDTSVGENGVQLSGGQRQRIAIARALLRSAPIILLDEATASLDSSTERKIQDALGKLTAGRAAIVIAHRLSTVMDADRILVIERGRIVETGRHHQLLHKGGLYKELCRLQFPDAFPKPALATG
jgi:ATP-binding cassette, subfamily B, bacterial MsbA